MKKISRKFDAVVELIPQINTDERGAMVRLYDDKVFGSLGLNTHWVQTSYSYTAKPYTIRGLHIQTPPFTEAKLLRLVHGELLWLVIDLRKDSKTLGQWDAVRLSGKVQNSLYVPRGFGHGCMSLTNECHLVIQTDNYFSAEHGEGIVWNDRDLNIEWPLDGQTPIISQRDANYLTFKQYCKKMGI